VLRGVRRGAKLYVVDPRRTVSAQWADLWLGLDVGSDIALAFDECTPYKASREYTARSTDRSSPLTLGHTSVGRT